MFVKKVDGAIYPGVRRDLIFLKFKKCFKIFENIHQNFGNFRTLKQIMKRSAVLDTTWYENISVEFFPEPALRKKAKKFKNQKNAPYNL